MNNEQKVEHMIEVIMEVEKRFVQDRLNTTPVAKKNAVKAIHDEIVRITSDEDKNH